MPRTARSIINAANAARQADHFWSAERVATLRAMWAARECASAIADAIGGGCTRSMVIGKANRLKLEARPGWHSHRRATEIRVSRETSVPA